MSNALIHAERSAKRWGGVPCDYIMVHEWLDQTKNHLCDNRHRMVLHNSFGIGLCVKSLAPYITNKEGRRVFVRDIAEQHVLEDLGRIPSLSECLAELPCKPWMAGIGKRYLPAGDAVGSAIALPPTTKGPDDEAGDA